MRAQGILQKLPIAAMPMLIAAVLSLPGTKFPFLWDDYDFLGRAQVFQIGHLAPDSASVYWRPISRELYFTLLYRLGPLGPAVGHAVNLLLLMIATLLVTNLGTRMAGRTTGLFAGLLFATYPHLPVLVSWISGDQDLLAMVFALLAIRMRLDGKLAFSALALLLALLSKEIALAIVPVLVAMDWLLGQKPRRLLGGILAYGSVACAWAILHPAVRTLLSRRLEAGPGSSVGVHSEALVPNLQWGVGTLLNIPQGQVRSDALAADWLLVILALGLSTVAVLLLTRNRASSPPGSARVILLGMVLCVLPLASTTTLVDYKSPYYLCFPFIGASLALGTLLSKWRTIAALAALLLFVGLGGIARAVPIDPEVPTVWNLAPAAATLNAVERDFKRIVPEIQGKATAYVSVQSSGYTGVQTHIHRLQALRIWYRNPELATLAPHQSIPDPGAELVFWVSPTYHVYHLDPRSLRVSGVGPPPSGDAYKKVLRRFAIGRATAGELPTAVGLLTRIESHDRIMRAYDYRLAAALLIAGREPESAETLLVGVPQFDWDSALDATLSAIGDYSPEIDRDEAIMNAFGIGSDDQRAIRSLMLGFDSHGVPAPALRFARRVLAHDPSDPDARRILDRAASAVRVAPLTIPVPHRG